VTVIDEYKPAAYWEAWHRLFQVSADARALLDLKTCVDCEFGGSNDANLLCTWKVSNGPLWARNVIPATIGKDYANECNYYKKEKPE